SGEGMTAGAGSSPGVPWSRLPRARDLARSAWRAREFTTDASALALAAAVAAAALHPLAWSPAVPLVLAVAAWCVRRPVLLVLAAALLTATLAQRAIDGARPAEPSAFQGRAELVTDPDDAFGSLRAEVRTQ